MSDAKIDHELLVPDGGFWPAPEIPLPNIYPMEWRVETEKLAAIYQKSKLMAWNPADLPWDGLRAEDFTTEQRLGIMYWFAVLANFDASGPAVFARATIRAFEQHEEDPVRKCFFSNNNIGWLYHNGGRYWNGYNKAVGRYSLPVLFTSFMMGEMAASTLFRGMASGTEHPVFSEMFHRIGRDESRHLQICMTILENEWPGLTDDVRATITRQLRAGFIFLSMILWEPPEGFWDLPPYFLNNHRVLMDHARQAGLGVLSYEEQAENWRGAIAKIRVIVQRWGIEFPAMPELDIEGVDVSDDISAEDIIPVF